MNENESPQDQRRTKVLNLVFAMVLTAVVLAIGTVAWNCVDSLQKRTGQLHNFHVTPENTKIDSTHFDIAKDMDSRIYDGEMDPNAAIRIPIVKLDGAEGAFDRGTKAIGKRQFGQGITDFSEVLAALPLEQINKRSWQMAGAPVDRSVFTFNAYQYRSYCYLQTGKYKLAIADLNAAIKLVPGHVQSYENRAKAYFLLGDRALGDADMKTVARLNGKGAQHH